MTGTRRNGRPPHDPIQPAPAHPYMRLKGEPEMMRQPTFRTKPLCLCVLFFAGWLGTCLWAQTPPAISFGSAIQAEKQVRESRDLAGSVAAPDGPQWRAKGDLHRKYHFAEAGWTCPTSGVPAPGTGHNCRWSDAAMRDRMKRLCRCQ